jgi:hypothetical protein
LGCKGLYLAICEDWRNRWRDKWGIDVRELRAEMDSRGGSLRVAFAEIDYRFLRKYEKLKKKEKRKVEKKKKKKERKEGEKKKKIETRK